MIVDRVKAARPTVDGPAKVAPVMDTWAVAGALAAILLWAGTPVATRIGALAGDGLTIGLWRTLLAAAVALVLLRTSAAPPPGASRGLLLAAGLSNFAVFPLLFSLGIAHSSATHGALLLALLPVFTSLFAFLFDGERPGRRWAFGSLAALIGTPLVILGREGEALAEGALLGDSLLLASVVAVSFGYVTSAKAARGWSSWAVTLRGLIIGALALLAIMPFLPAESRLPQSTEAWLAIGYLALLGSLLGYVLWTGALARGASGKIGQLQFLQPLASLALAVWLLGEGLSPASMAGAALILIGVAWAQGLDGTLFRRKEISP